VLPPLTAMPTPVWSKQPSPKIVCITGAVMTTWLLRAPHEWLSSVAVTATPSPMRSAVAGRASERRRQWRDDDALELELTLPAASVTVA
jgi:hypothetical protein